MCKFWVVGGELEKLLLDHLGIHLESRGRGILVLREMNSKITRMLLKKWFLATPALRLVCLKDKFRESFRVYCVNSRV